MLDVLLCPMTYFVENQCVDFTTRRPYPVIQRIAADSWLGAQERATVLLEEFAAAIRADAEP